MNTLRPLAYGYLRLPDDVDDPALRDLELRLRTYAEKLGFEFATIFYEEASGSRRAFDELIEELQRADAHHVILPSSDHLSCHPYLRITMADSLTQDATAEVHELDD